MNSKEPFVDEPFVFINWYIDSNGATATKKYCVKRVWNSHHIWQVGGLVVSLHYFCGRAFV